MFTEDDIIDIYTRAQALADGVLVDCNTAVPGKDVPSEAGWKYPMAMTADVWALVNHPNPRALDWRLYDVCNMARIFYRSIDEHTRLFKVVLGDGKRDVEHTFKMVCSCGDDLEPVLTIMLPEED